MKINMTKFQMLLITLFFVMCLILVYYFIFLLPSYNKQKLNIEANYNKQSIVIEIQKQNWEIKANKADLSKKMQDDCIKEVQNSITYDFNLSNTLKYPVFYINDAPISFNKNERILTALDAYAECLSGDPRNNENEIIDKLILDAYSASLAISKHMMSVKKDNPDICYSNLLSLAAKEECDNIYIDFNIYIDLFLGIKSDKPKIELFVMSHCPYGIQMEKGILPVVKTLGDSIDFQLKFNSYAMHGEVEIVEQMNQYCIMEEQPEVFVDYLECFLLTSDSPSCLASAKVNATKLSSCYNNLEKEYNIVSDFENRFGYQGNYPSFRIHMTDNEKYRVGGSPTLVINGETISSERDSASLLRTICGAFNNPPESCNTQLPMTALSPGFGVN